MHLDILISLTLLQQLHLPSPLQHIAILLNIQDICNLLNHFKRSHRFYLFRPLISFHLVVDSLQESFLIDLTSSDNSQDWIILLRLGSNRTSLTSFAPQAVSSSYIEAFTQPTIDSCLILRSYVYSYSLGSTSHRRVFQSTVQQSFQDGRYT